MITFYINKTYLLYQKKKKIKYRVSKKYILKIKISTYIVVKNVLEREQRFQTKRLCKMTLNGITFQWEEGMRSIRVAFIGKRSYNYLSKT